MSFFIIRNHIWVLFQKCIWEEREWNLRRIKDHFEEVEIVENIAECMASIQQRPFGYKFKTISNKHLHLT